MVEKSSGEGQDIGPKELRQSGEVLESLPSFHFRVKLDDGQEILAYVSGKLRIHRIRVLPGDRVTVEMSPYDTKRGRIVYRGK
jgi:translation initiation factor IF-1